MLSGVSLCACQDHSRAELDAWQLVRVSPAFRVIALGLPVPHYRGHPLDPPLRSRFQARDIAARPYEVGRYPALPVSSSRCDCFLLWLLPVIADSCYDCFPISLLPDMADFRCGCFPLWLIPVMADSRYRCFLLWLIPVMVDSHYDCFPL